MRSEGGPPDGRIEPGTGRPRAHLRSAPRPPLRYRDGRGAGRPGHPGGADGEDPHRETGAVFRIQRAAAGHVTASLFDTFRSRALFPLGDPHAPEVYEVTLAPGCYQRARPHDRDTSGHLTVADGVLVVQTHHRVARLGPGDTRFFRADLPHSYRNATSGDTVVHLVVTHA